MIGIYKITNLINKKIYIGQSIDINRRFKEHIRISKLNKDNMPIHKAIYKYGIENFILEIIEECNIELLDEKEIYYINFFNSRDKHIGYNISFGGNTGPIKSGIDNINSILTEEIVIKIRTLYLEGYVKKQAYERINKIYPININTFSDVWIGKTYKNIHYYVYDDEYKSVIKEFRSINKSKLSNTNAKQYVLDIRNARCSGEQLSEYYKLHYSDKLNINTFKDIWYYRTYAYILPTIENKNIKNKKSYKRDVPVLQYSKDGILIKSYNGIINALLEIKGTYDKNMVSNIYRNCQGKSKSAYGYIWKFNNCND